MKNRNYFLGILLLFCLQTTMAVCQDVNITLNDVMKEDSVDVNVLAAYPANVRQNVFEVSAHPEGVTKLNDIQKKSNGDFKNAVASYSKEEQQKIWNITRYDGLVSKLVSGGQKSKAETEEIVKSYPKDVQEDAIEYSTHHFELLAQIDKLNKGFSDSFEGVIKPYPPQTQTAFRELIKTPEVITLLNNNMNMTVRIGDIYKSDPQLITQRFEELNLQLAQQKAKDLEDWKQTMQNDPDAKKELKQSADEYANANGYSESDYNNTNPTVVENYIYTPYPYWCGYPSWYSDPYWYPYPFWYHSGFYFWNGDFVWMGMPSWYFLHWHFYHHDCLYNYPHLTNAYLHYYHGPRRAVMTNSREVNQWVRDNKKSLPKGYLKNDAGRPERIKEYGKFQVDYDKQNRNNAGSSIPRSTFLQQHATDYPHLQPSQNQSGRSNGTRPDQTMPGRQPEPRQQNSQPRSQPIQREQPVQQQQRPRMQTQPRQNREVRPSQPSAPRSGGGGGRRKPEANAGVNKNSESTEADKSTHKIDK